MKWILIAIDNDPTSETIAFGGLNLAKKLNTEIGLLSVLDNSNFTATELVTPQELALEIQIEVRKNLKW